MSYVRIALVLLSLLVVCVALSSCSTVTIEKYYENGQLQEKTVKSGVIFSDGKTFVLKP